METQNNPIKLRQTLLNRLNGYITENGIRTLVRSTCKGFIMLIIAGVMSNPKMVWNLVIFILTSFNGFPISLLFVIGCYKYRKFFLSIPSRIKKDFQSDEPLSKSMLNSETITIKSLMEKTGMSFRKADKLLRKLEDIGVVTKDPTAGNARILAPDITPEKLSEIIDGNEIEDMTSVSVIPYQTLTPFKVKQIV